MVKVPTARSKRNSEVLSGKARDAKVAKKKALSPKPASGKAVAVPLWFGQFKAPFKCQFARDGLSQRAYMSLGIRRKQHSFHNPSRVRKNIVRRHSSILDRCRRLETVSTLPRHRALTTWFHTFVHWIVSYAQGKSAYDHGDARASGVDEHTHWYSRSIHSKIGCSALLDLSGIQKDVVSTG